MQTAVISFHFVCNRKELGNRCDKKEQNFKLFSEKCQFTPKKAFQTRINGYNRKFHGHHFSLKIFVALFICAKFVCS